MNHLSILAVRVPVLTMLSKIFLAFALAIAVHAAPLDARDEDVNIMPVFTATRMYLTTTDVAPYIITATTTMTWTQSPSTTVAFATAGSA
ncbi:hypothetical protein FB451DRAFT_189402 [Mycena latifolia]|nr:hypothetical protein FB451DRAFT_189402 [Mycena latifolia]